VNLKVWEDRLDSDDADQLYLRLFPREKAIVLLTCYKNGDKIDAGTILQILTKHKVILINSGLNPLIPIKTDISNTPLYYTEEEIDDLDRKIAMEHFATAMSQKMNEEEKKVSH